MNFMGVKNLTINPKVFFKINFLIISVFIILHIIFELCNYYFDPIPFIPDIQIYKAFNLNQEGNIPTAYQALMIFTSSAFLFLLSLSAKSKNEKSYFRIFSCLMFFIGFDEKFALHEQFIEPIRNLFNTSGFFYFAWVIPYGILVLICALFFYGLINTFPPNIRKLIFLSGVIYILGELGFELISGNLVSLYGPKSAFNQTQSFYYSFLTTIEESFGLIGILFFNFALLKLLKIRSEIVKIRIS